MDAHLPRAVSHGVLALCVLPLLLSLVGFDLGSPPPPAAGDAITGADALHRALAGSFVHTVLEWSAFLAALFTVVLAFTHYRIEGDPATPVIAMALFCASALDVFHILAADRLIGAVADNHQLIPFTWALSRLFNALILIAGPLLLFLRPPGAKAGDPKAAHRRTLFVLSSCGLFALFAYGLVYVCSHSTRLPQTLFPDEVISRPWDVAPLLLFMVAATVLRGFHRRHPSVFTAALFLSCLPQIATQLYMAFGSTSLFDHGFNAAHGLKVVAYTVPFVGLVLDYVHSHQLARRSNKELESQVRERTKELRHAEAAALDASGAKSDFLARMSHELRTPLNSILGYAQIFHRDDTLDARQRKGLDVIERSGEHLLNLINEILDLSKIEARKLEITRRSFRLPLLLQQIAESEGLRAEQRGLTWTYEPSSSLPDRVQGDDRRLRQILLNLLGNAIKYTEGGGVTLRAGRPAGDEEKVCFEVHDTGVGIAQGDLKQIFLPFQQTREASRRADGSGLGLAITSQLVELMEGQIEVESEPGEGSIFRVTLLLPSTDEQTEPTATEDLPVVGYEGERRNLLVVDDKAGNRAILIGLLAPLGFEIIEAGDGEEAVAKTLAEVPDLILMDLVMPVLDGFAATRRLRREGILVPVVALSASVFERNQEASRAAGCNDFLPKPVRLEDLLQIIRRHLDLQWIHAEPQRRRVAQPLFDKAPDDPEACLPTEEAHKLLDLARRGAVREITTELNRLAAEDCFTAPAERLRRHAEQYDMKAIRDVLESWLEGEG